MSDQWFMLRNDKRTAHALAELREMASAGQLLPTDMIQPPGSPQWVAAAQAEGVVDWYYAVSGQQGGPVSWAALRQLAEQKTLKPTDLVWHAGMGEWDQAVKIDGLVPKAPAAKVPPPLPKSILPPAAPSAARTTKVTGEVKIPGTGGVSGGLVEVDYRVEIHLDGQKIGEGSLLTGVHVKFETTVGQHSIGLIDKRVDSLARGGGLGGLMGRGLKAIGGDKFGDVKRDFPMTFTQPIHYVICFKAARSMGQPALPKEYDFENVEATE